MELKMSIGMNLLLVFMLMVLGVTCRPQSHRHHQQQNHHTQSHRSYDSRHHNNHHHHHQNVANSDPTTSNNSDNNNNNNGNEETVATAGRMSGSGSTTGGGGGKSSWRHASRDDDYDYDEEGERHAYLMTPNKAQKVEVQEDDAITSAFEKHMRPNHHSHHRGGGSSSSSSSSSTNAKSSQSPPPPEHDVYAYQLPSSLWFIVRYAKDPDGHMEKYMNIVDSFSNYLEKLEKVKTVSVNDLKGVETVFKLTPQHKPFHH